MKILEDSLKPLLLRLMEMTMEEVCTHFVWPARPLSPFPDYYLSFNLSVMNRRGGVDLAGQTGTHALCFAGIIKILYM